MHPSLLAANRSTLRHVERIALEAGFLADMKKMLSQSLPSFIAELGSLKNLFGDTQQPSHCNEIFKFTPRAHYKAQHLDFLIYGEALVSVPENFSGHYLDYAVSLARSLNIAHDRIVLLLAHINSYLSVLVTNREQHTSTKDVSRMYHEAGQERETILRDLQLFFPEENGVAKQAIRNVLYRFADINTMREHVATIGKSIARYRLNEIKSQTQETTDLVTMLVAQLNDTDVKAITPAVAKTVSAGLYETARYVELVSMLYYDTTVFLKCYNDLLEHIVKA